MIDASAADLIRAAMPLHQSGRLAEASILYDQVLRRDPDNHDALHLKGLIAHQQGRHDEAIDYVGRAVKMRDSDPIFWFNFGNVLRAGGRHLEAIDAYRHAISLGPDFVDAYKNLANALDKMNRADEADAARQTVAALQPQGGEAMYRMGVSRELQGDLSAAVDAYRRAIQLEKDHAGAHVQLATALASMGQNDEALAVHRHLLAVRPIEAKYHSNMLLCLQYSDRITADELFTEHLNWAKKYADPLTPPPLAPRPRTSPRLRIGYISSDFRQHAVALFFEPLLSHHDRNKFEIFCYAANAEVDEVTLRLKSLAEHWREVAKISEPDLAKKISTDKIDILIDLTGHTARNRLLAIALRPAPVAATYLGYPGTTGMLGIDFRITDPIADPPGETEKYYTEKLIRLPGCFLCFAVPWRAPEVSPPPFQTNGYISFGSFNHAGKISDSTVRLWSAVLHAVPNSKLVIKAHGLADVQSQSFLTARFAHHQISPDRFQFLPAEHLYEEHLARYSHVDIGLDPFPYNGTTTTCEALWMGIPIVTLAGKTHVARVGASLLTAVDLPNLITHSHDNYITTAATLAKDAEHLTHLRTTMRQRMQSSPLMNAQAFTQNFEHTLEKMHAEKSS